MKEIRLVEKLKESFSYSDLEKIKNTMIKIRGNVETISNKNNSVHKIIYNGSSIEVKKEFLLNEIDQILKTKTIERTKYYIKRLTKALSETKTGKINDLNLNRWKEYNDIITDSLWIIDKRDKSGVHKADYWGNFIPQIPNQFIRRFTKRYDWVLDTFAGSGTTLIESKRLGRNCIGIELNPAAAKHIKENIKREKSKFNVNSELILGDSGLINLTIPFKKLKIASVQLIIMHPPYWDIIKFSKNKNDLSNAKSVNDFLKMFGNVLDNTHKYLDDGRYLALVIGDKYSSGEWIPLGFYTMQEVLRRGFKLKSTIVKNFDVTKGKMNQNELWRYRALAGGFYIFKHEYIFLFQKHSK